jgi:hypothetical protein
VFTDNLADQLSPLKNRASSLFSDATKKANSLDDYLINSIGNSVGFRWDAWLLNHPFLAWVVNHPLISLISSLIIIILTIRLLATIYRAIANTIDRMWLGILRSPFLLLKLLFGWEIKPKTATSNATVTNYEVTNNPEQLEEIIARLDRIQQQQQQIIQDVAQLKHQQFILEPTMLQLIDTTSKPHQDKL